MYDNPRRLRRPEERVGTYTNASLPPPDFRADANVLIERIRARDESAFAYLHDCYQPAMLRIAQTFVRNREEAEEVIQDTWIAVIKGIDKFEQRSSFKTWLFRILVNRARSRARREARSIAIGSLADSNAFDRLDAALAGAAIGIGTRPTDPQQELLDGELRSVVEKAVSDLPALQQLVVSLRDIEGWTAEEVCSTLKITSANQRVSLHRGRMRVRELISPYLAEISSG